MSRDGLSFLDRRQSAGPGKASFQYRARHARTQGQRTSAVDSHGAWAADTLTEREIKVLQLLRGSLLMREIAVELGLSRNTVKSHTRAIYRKLGVSTRHDAISRESPPQLRPGGTATIAEPLTERETEVLELLDGSLPLREIAVKLRLSPNTVKSHTRAIYRKLGVSTRHEAITRGQGADILPPGTGRHAASFRDWPAEILVNEARQTAVLATL
jgi:DNA-binding NarL/FixJ family response regulator